LPVLLAKTTDEDNNEVTVNFSTGAALCATWASQAARQPASSPFCALGRPEPQLQPKPRSGKVPQWKSDFSELSMFFKRYIPVCECAFLIFNV
jgi:hypothetical protein